SPRQRDEVPGGLPGRATDETRSDIDQEGRLVAVRLDEVPLEATVTAHELQAGPEPVELRRQVTGDLDEVIGVDRLGRPRTGVADEQPVRRRDRRADGHVAPFASGDGAPESARGGGCGHVVEPTR